MNGVNHTTLLAEWLPRVGQDPRSFKRHELLAGGVSGSFVYRLHGPAAPCVLKLTLAASAAYVRQRAQREVEFYRSPAGTRQGTGALPVRVPRLLASAVEPGSGASALLLAAYSPPLTPAAWQPAHYLEFGHQLARLHAAYWNATERLAAWCWLRPPATISPADVRAA